MGGLLSNANESTTLALDDWFRWNAARREGLLLRSPTRPLKEYDSCRHRRVQRLDSTAHRDGQRDARLFFDGWAETLAFGADGENHGTFDGQSLVKVGAVSRDELDPGRLAP